jgi:oligopeptide transport system permease protein
MKRALCLCALLLLGTLSIPLLPLADPAAVHPELALAAPTLATWWLPRSEPNSAQWNERAREALFGPRELAPLWGRDALGRCVLSRTLYGARASLLVAVVASLAALIIGVSVGASAGFFGGRFDSLLMRSTDIFGALPLIFMVIFAVGLLRTYRTAHPETVLNPNLALLGITAAVSWIPAARIVRADVLRLRQATFVEAARCMGTRDSSILRLHVIPNSMPVALSAWTLTVPRVLMLESFLSFLGLGMEAPDVSWGVLLRQGHEALTAVHLSWWLILAPALALTVTLLLLNHLGEQVRIHLAPRRGEAP